MDDIGTLCNGEQYYGYRENISKYIENENEDMLPAYSPNGRYLAYTVRTKGKRKRGPYTIALMDFKSKGKINKRIILEIGE